MRSVQLLSSNRRSRSGDFSHDARSAGAACGAQFLITLPATGVLGDVRYAFLGLSIDAGQKVPAAMMEADGVARCGPKGVPDAARGAVRGGTTASQVVLGGSASPCGASRRVR
jgi:hypothetical protein